MISTVLLVRESIEQALAALPEPWWPADAAVAGTGAWLEFRGIVRAQESPDGSAESFPIAAIDYEAHEEMARHQMEQIVERLGSRHPLEAMLVIHRIGRVRVGEASLFLRICSPHRQEALEACREFLDELKSWVPIWKHPLRA